MSHVQQSSSAANWGAGCLLLVGPAGRWEESIRAAIAGAGERGAVERCETFLSALGALGTGRRPRVILGKIDGVNGALAATAAAVHRLAPEAMLVGVVAGGDAQASANAARRDGFDAVLTEPIDSAALQQVLREPRRRDAASGSDVSGGALAGPGAPGPVAPSAAGQGVAPAKAAVRDDPADAILNHGSDALLTDLDLAEHALGERRDLPNLALRLIRERTGLVGLGLAVGQEAVAPGRVWVAVQHGGRSFGKLHGPAGTTASQLEPWGEWLARWLALDQRAGRLWDMALRDDLTGAWSRRYFFRFLSAVLKRAATERFSVTVLFFDIDDFKIYNDRYGHAAGDEILCQTAALMQSVVRGRDVVSRFGGDEFAVIFWDAEAPRRPDSRHPQDVREAAARFQRAIGEHKFPKLLDEAPETLTISGGLASFPWDGRTPQELVELADAMALQSKRQGKNAITLGPGAMQAGIKG